MRNFRLAIKMMVMALAMGALFCSCNAAGGSDCYDASASKAINTEMNSNGPVQAGFSIVIPEVSVSISGADKVVRNEVATITADATEGATITWYVNGELQKGEAGTTYELISAYPGIYEVACIAASADGLMVGYDTMTITVTP